MYMLDAIDWLRLVETSIGAAVGTLIGALLAFRFEHQRRKKQQEDAEVQAANTAIFALMRAWNDLSSYREHIVDKAKGKANIWYSLDPGNVARTADRPNLDGLAFLFESDPNLLNLVAQAWAGYESIVESVASRSTVHMDQAQPRIETAIGLKPSVTEEELLAACGPRVHGILKGYTDGITENIDEAIRDLYDAGHQLRDAVKTVHGKRKIIGWKSSAGPAQ